MYARYVPGSAGAGSTKTDTTQSAKPSTVAATMAAPTSYGRYIPGSGIVVPSVQHTASEPEEERPAKKARLSPQPDSESAKQRKKRKSKTRTSAVESSFDSDTSSEGEADAALPTQADSSTDEVSSGEDAETAASPAEPSPEPEKISKKPKREKKKKALAADESEGEDEVQKRHKAVFERKRKSMQAPSAAEEEGEAAMDGEDAEMADAPSPEDAHGLEPLPQPAPVEIVDTKPTFETLPPWLAEPVRVSPLATADFVDLSSTPELGIPADVARQLAVAGYKNAFAIQTAVIPLLLPHHCKSRQGDVLVSAATGSGKTLAYVLPMIRDLSHGNRRLTRLRSLVVLPTRELVKQAQQVCEEMAGAFATDGARRRVRIGVSMGSQNFEKEQATFVEREEQYDPQAYAAKQKHVQNPTPLDDDLDETDDEEKLEVTRRESRIATLPDHVVKYKSKIDVLICTPGRLVEHIKYTPGFSLDFVRWLVVDEADKLLGQDFQQWLDVVIPKLQQTPHRNFRNHHHTNLSGVRKVILSATMTRDLERLGGLKLRRPSLVVLEGSGSAGMDVDFTSAEHAIPELLEESALKVNDPNLKPVFLVDLLRSRKLLGEAAGKSPIKSANGDDTSSEEEVDTSSSEEDTSSEEEQESDSDVSSHHSVASQSSDTKQSGTPSVLIFTKSNETAMRLSRLLSLISPELMSLVGTLTSTTAYSTRRQTLRDFTAGKLRVLVASDLVARGIDLPSLDHVINYDMPTSVASYIHRVGRTARAGKSGKAWTLFTKAEARWFWNEIAGPKSIKRPKEVQRIRITEEKEDLFEEKVKIYEDALETLGQEAKRGRN